MFGTTVHILPNSVNPLFHSTLTIIHYKVAVNIVAVRIAETLGSEKALELLYCTEDLEEAGGLMILVSYYI